MKIQPGEGWVRAKFASNTEELQRLRSTIDELRAKLEAARTEPPVEAKSLARGTETFLVKAIIQKHEHSVALTWDDIFACIGPAMFDEAPENDLAKLLKDKIMSILGRKGNWWEIDLRSEDFHTIKVQLLALGLIQMSVKRRSLKDTQSYWKLTPYGEHYATVLKAIPAGLKSHKSS